MDEYIRSDEEASGQLLADRHGLEDLMKLAQQKPRPFDGIVFDETSLDSGVGFLMRCV